MGLNVNLVRMIGAPTQCKCPGCHRIISTNFDDFDIECGDPNPTNGNWKLSAYCHDCGTCFDLEFQITINPIQKL